VTTSMSILSRAPTEEVMNAPKENLDRAACFAREEGARHPRTEWVVKIPRLGRNFSKLPP
jgi:hypothetical protein